MSLLWCGKNDFKRGYTSKAVHQATVRKDMMDLRNIQKQKYFYIIFQLYTCAFPVIQFFIIAVIEHVGYSGQFLDKEHTLKHFRSGELLETELFARGGRETWVAAGAKDLETRAREKARYILKTYKVVPLPDHVIRELDSLMAKQTSRLEIDEVVPNTKSNNYLPVEENVMLNNAKIIDVCTVKFPRTIKFF